MTENIKELMRLDSISNLLGQMQCQFPDEQLDVVCRGLVVKMFPMAIKTFEKLESEDFITCYRDVLKIVDGREDVKSEEMDCYRAIVVRFQSKYSDLIK